MAVTLNLTGNIVQAEDAGVLLPAYEYIMCTPTATATTGTTVFVNPSLGGTYVVAGVSVVYSTAGSGGTVTVEVATGTQAPGSGTAQLTGTIALNGTANTTLNGTVIASPTVITAGSRINFISTTATSLANCQMTILLKRVS